MVARKGKTRREFYARKQAQLEDELAAVESDIETAQTTSARRKLEKQAEKLLDEIDEIEAKLAAFDADSPNANVRDRGLEKKLQKINFTDAKNTARLIKEKLDEDGGLASFFLQKTKIQKGQFCIEEVIEILLGEQKLGDEIFGTLKYPVDLDSTTSTFNESEFLKQLGSHFGIAEDDEKNLLEKIRGNLCSLMGSGTNILVTVKGLDELLDIKGFTQWFVEDFWNLLVDELPNHCKSWSSKLIVILVANGEVFPEYSPEYFCQNQTIDCTKLMALSLPNWSVADIYEWLRVHRPLYPKLKGKNNQQLKKIAEDIHGYSFGIPQSICTNLEEDYLCLKRSA